RARGCDAAGPRGGGVGWTARARAGPAGAQPACRVVSGARREATALAGGAALLRQPRLAQLAAFLFGRAAPDPRVLVGRERELEALLVHVAGGADASGSLDLLEGRAGAPDGEEDVGVGIAARRLPAPRVHVPVVSSDPGERHEASGTRGRRASRAREFVRTFTSILGLPTSRQYRRVLTVPRARKGQFSSSLR